MNIFFQDLPDVYVSGDMFIYYEEGNPAAVVAPEVFAVLGAPKHDRSSYMLWLEPKGPDFVMEITSASTRSIDQGVKRGIYASLGIREYFLYDPTGDYLHPQLQGLRLLDGNYVPISSSILPGGALCVHSDVLGLELRLEGGEFRFFDPSSGKRLLTHRETEQARRAAEELAHREAMARQLAEARVAELEARLRSTEQ